MISVYQHWIWRIQKIKLFNWIFAKNKKQEELQQTWTFKHNGWEASAIAYNRMHGLPDDAI